MTYISTYLEETKQIVDKIDQDDIASAVALLRELKQRNGRLFILGNGGSAANASHAVNDFRKIAGIEAYTPTDNVAELTAITNDISWYVVYADWLRESRLCENDLLIVLSVGGGTDTTSTNLVRAMRNARIVSCPILAIVSRDGGMALKLSAACVLIPVVAEQRLTPHAEEWQSILLHLIVNALMEGK